MNNATLAYIHDRLLCNIRLQKSTSNSQKWERVEQKLNDSDACIRSRFVYQIRAGW
jgi:hypothetical protein